MIIRVIVRVIVMVVPKVALAKMTMIIVMIMLSSSN